MLVGPVGGAGDSRSLSVSETNNARRATTALAVLGLAGTGIANSIGMYSKRPGSCQAVRNELYGNSVRNAK